MSTHRNRWTQREIYKLKLEILHVIYQGINIKDCNWKRIAAKIGGDIKRSSNDCREKWRRLKKQMNQVELSTSIKPITKIDLILLDLLSNTERNPNCHDKMSLYYILNINMED